MYNHLYNYRDDMYDPEGLHKITKGEKTRLPEGNIWPH